MSYHNKKEFACPLCKRDFKKKRQLKGHMKDAHGVSYSCKNCGTPAIENSICVRCHEES